MKCAMYVRMLISRRLLSRLLTSGGDGLSIVCCVCARRMLLARRSFVASSQMVCC
jgi:hypothetical protein